LRFAGGREEGIGKGITPPYQCTLKRRPPAVLCVIAFRQRDVRCAFPYPSRPSSTLCLCVPWFAPETPGPFGVLPVSHECLDDTVVCPPCHGHVGYVTPPNKSAGVLPSRVSTTLPTMPNDLLGEAMAPKQCPSRCFRCHCVISTGCVLDISSPVATAQCYESFPPVLVAF